MNKITAWVFLGESELVWSRENGLRFIIVNFSLLAVNEMTDLTWMYPDPQKSRGICRKDVNCCRDTRQRQAWLVAADVVFRAAPTSLCDTDMQPWLHRC